MRLGTQIAISLGAFALASVLAELFGAANLGTALTFGQLAFVGTAAVLMIKT